MKRRKLKKRYIAAALMVAASIVATPVCVTIAYEQRGNTSPGGEWLVVPLGIILAYIMLEMAKVWDRFLLCMKRDDEEHAPIGGREVLILEEE